MKTRLAFTTSISLSTLCVMSGCDFANSASELTFGAGSLPSLEQSMEYPSVDQLVGLDEMNQLAGLPMSLNQGTMAHLVGALGVGGECGKKLDLSEGELGGSVLSAEFELAACTEDDRCSDLCPDGFLGLNARTHIEAVVMTAKQAKEISQTLSKDSANAIVQVRFQMRALEFYQGEGDEREITNDHISDFEMIIGTPGVESISFLNERNLVEIREGAVALSEGEPEGRFERYELPRDHPTTKKIIDDILEGKDVVISVEQSFKIGRESLYDLRLSPAGIFQSIQPEVVINAIEAATSTLGGL
jgi:hypothetical protein